MNAGLKILSTELPASQRFEPRRHVTIKGLLSWLREESLRFSGRKNFTGDKNSPVWSLSRSPALSLQKNTYYQRLLSTGDDPSGRCCSSSSQTPLCLQTPPCLFSQIRRGKFSFFGATQTWPSNSFTPVLRRAADIMCKWIFKRFTYLHN